MEKVLKDRKAIAFFLLPALLLFLLIVILPILMSAQYSLTEWDGTRQQVFIGLENYRALFSNGPFLNAMWHSVLFAAAAVLIQLPLSMLLALVLSNVIKRASRFFVTVYFIPVILSSVVIGQLWMRIYNQRYGVLNLFFKAVGLENLTKIPWLGDMNTALIAVMIPVLWQYVGYHMLLFYSGIKSIPNDIYEAATIDGASFWRTTLHITFPLLRPIISVSVTFAVVGSMKVYDLVKVLTGGGPAGASEVISTLLVRTMFYPSNQYGYGSAMAIILIVECFALYMLINGLFRERGEKRKGRPVK